MAAQYGQFQTSWIKESITRESVKFAEGFGKFLADGRDALTTSQIRNFFGEVKRIQQRGFEREQTAFLLLLPKLAYAEARVVSKAHRNANPKIKDFKKVMEQAYYAVQTLEDSDEKIARDSYQRLVNFLEAILAFHKAAGGRD